MKLLIASDIHGSAFWCEALMHVLDGERFDRAILLGDLLYHGPRNDLPEEYNPKKVIEMLNARKEHFLCVRGNCEAEVDQMVLKFPVLADYATVFADRHMFYATHGHHFNLDNPPALQKGDFLLCGHTHVSGCIRREHFTYLNPGSTSIPKSGTPHSYAVLESGVMVWYDLSNGKEYMRERLW